ncbi:MAG: zinc-ribbon domain-containing protein [Sandaracinaceae bacterium]|nr:zinc-ribbon domain-containing protein [Sandaracinaceae bacterium]
MKFLCPNCKAKYQISDEKITGRTLKMDCRRCSHAIVIRGDKVAASAGRETRSSSSALKQQRPSYAGPGPAPALGSGRNSLGADFRSNPSTSAPSQRPTALDQWHIAINDVPVGPMKRDEVARKIASGAVDKESLCWREGLDDWRPLKNVPELSSLLRRAGPAAPKKQPPLPPPPARPMGASRPGRPPTGRQPVSRPAPTDASRPAARGNVVPIGGRSSAAPKLDELSDDFVDDEPTRVGELDFAKLEADSRAAAEEESRRKEEDRERARERKERDRQDRERRERDRQDRDRERQDREREERDRQERERQDRERRDREERDRAAAFASAPEEDEEAVVAAVGLAPTAEIAHSDAFDPFASDGGAVASAPAAFAPAPSAVPMEALPAERRQRAIPIGAWIAIAGAASFGVVLAIMVGTHFLTTPQPIAAVEPPVVREPTPPPPPVEAEPDPTLVEEPVAEEPVAEDPVEEPAEEPAEAPATTGSGTGRRGTSAPAEARPTTTTSGRSGATLDPETQARLARFAGSDSDQAPNLNVPGAGTTLPGEERGSSTSAELTSEQVRAVVSRERAGVQRCYETFARQSGQAPSLRLDVDVTVGASGTVTRAVTRGATFGDVNDCVERTVRRWRFPRTGSVSQISIPFVFTGRE